jgi:hypothetical protein
MANFKYNDPLLNAAYGYAGQGRTDMAPRIAGSYNMNPSGGQMPYAPTQMAFLGDNAGYSMPGPTFPQDQFYGNYQDGLYFGRQGGDASGRYQFGYDTLGSPQVDPMSISPGGTNEVTEIGIPQTDYTGGFDTRTLEDPGVSGPFIPEEYKTAPPPSGDAKTAETPGTPETPKTPETPEVSDGTTAGQEKSFDAAGAATGVGQIVGGITNIVMGARALKDVDIAGAEAGVREAYATRPGLGTPVEFYNMQKEAYDQRLMAMRVEDINRGLATNVAAAAQYGARGLGSTLAATAQAQRAQQQEILQQQRLQMSALGTLAQAREREIQRREQRATFDIGMAYDNLKAEQAREQYARQQIAQGIVGTAAGIARTAVTFGAEQGAKVTPGEFSHDTNPIDIVQEGTKIGEMTGGEYIFNPRQAKQMAREATKGNSPLHKFVRKTLNKFHKDAAKYEGK